MASFQAVTLADSKQNFHALSDKWTFWTHLPHDTNWNINSYKPVLTFSTAEEIISLLKVLPEKLVKNCMLFMMRDGIQPTWEDEKNKDGGCFSYKISNKVVKNIWNSLCYSIVGETISNDPKFIKCINGITISPKKAFCIIKIWMYNCDYQNPAKIINIDGLSSQGCIFKKHLPEY
tara:strand:- start:1974 stop:2501 length:528 start_codon:yes stop_codon:yes gene_type:complete